MKNMGLVWILASRPKTLMAGIAPIIIAVGLALYEDVFKFNISIICLFIAIFFQMSSNFANDYFDYKKGADNSQRLGPKRAVAEGWIKPEQMLYATFITMTLASLLGLFLMCLVTWKLIFIGILIGIVAIAYSGGKYPLAYHGFGDISVLIFYGIVPVVLTYYLQALNFSFYAFICGIAIGLVSINILVANNYRDYQSDKNSKKRTTIVIFGKKFGEYFYLINGILAVALVQYFWIEKVFLVAVLPFLYLILHIITWKKMVKIKQGYELINILSKTAINTLIFAILLFFGFVFSTYIT